MISVFLISNCLLSTTSFTSSFIIPIGEGITLEGLNLVLLYTV